MRVSASHGKQSASTGSVIAKKPTALVIPIRELKGMESIALGFRMEMLSMGKDLGSVATGTGLGSDFINLKWRKREACIRGSELLKAWVQTFAPEDAARFPEEIQSVPTSAGVVGG
jgi:hypothetical protein